MTAATVEMTLQQAIQLGARLARAGEVERAISCFTQVLAHDRNDVGLLSELSSALQRANRLDEAAAQLYRARALRPSLAELAYNLGNVERLQGSLSDAIGQYRQAISIRSSDPRMRLGLAMALLLDGQWAEGFAAYESRPTRLSFLKRAAGSRIPLWRGESLKGRRILIVAEQGAGDVIQFIRYAGLLEREGAAVQVLCPASLVDLISSARGVHGASSTPPENIDTVEQIMSLPYRMGTRLDAVPAPIPYLYAPEASPLEKRRGPLRIGIAWSGDPRHPRDAWRSCPLNGWAPILRQTGFEFYSLQLGPSSRDLGALDVAVIDMEKRIRDFSSTAAIVAQLDLVISVDTSVCHLAGALGKPVWTLLSAASDWRWLKCGASTSWYPTMRLFRQRKLGDWSDVIAEVASALRGDQALACASLALPREDNSAATNEPSSS